MKQTWSNYTGEACRRRQPVRRVLFSARKEIAKQLEKMQKDKCDTTLRESLG